MLPMLFWIKVKSRDTSFRLFFPLILLYILLLIPFLLCCAIYCIMMLLPRETKQARAYLLFVLKSPWLLSAARGMEIMVHSNDSDIKMFVK